MAERIHLVGGELDTRHRPDGGFVVEATIPVPIDPMRGTP
jgi:signal transduction histidine kinase